MSFFPQPVADASVQLGSTYVLFGEGWRDPEAGVLDLDRHPDGSAKRVAPFTEGGESGGCYDTQPYPRRIRSADESEFVVWNDLQDINQTGTTSAASPPEPAGPTRPVIRAPLNPLDPERVARQFGVGHIDTVHECCHAAAGALLGLSVVAVQAAAGEGLTVIGHCPDDPDEVRWLAVATVAAPVLLRERLHLAAPECEDDLDRTGVLEAHFERLTGGNMICAAAGARLLLSRPEFARAMDRLLPALTERGILSGDEVSELLASLVGTFQL